MEAESGDLSVPPVLFLLLPLLYWDLSTCSVSPLEERLAGSGGSPGSALMRLIPPGACQHPRPLLLPGNLAAGPVPAASLTPVLF